MPPPIAPGLLRATSGDRFRSARPASGAPAHDAGATSRAYPSQSGTRQGHPRSCSFHSRSPPTRPHRTGAIVSYTRRRRATSAWTDLVSVSCLPASGEPVPPSAHAGDLLRAGRCGGTPAARPSSHGPWGTAPTAPSISGHTDEFVEGRPGRLERSQLQPADLERRRRCSLTSPLLVGRGVCSRSARRTGDLLRAGHRPPTSRALSFVIAVRDTTPPVLQLPPGIYGARHGRGWCSRVVLGDRESDLCHWPGLGTSCLPASGSLFPVGSTQVTCSAQDAAGNVANSSFTVAVGIAPDTTPPTIAAHADELAETTRSERSDGQLHPADGNRRFRRTLSRSAACPPRAPCSPRPTQVNCAAHDAAGNNASLSFSVIVRDTTPPTIAAHADLTAEAAGLTGATLSYTTPTASDSLDGPVAVSCLPVSGSLFGLGSTTVTCSAHDAAGNNAGSTFTVLVRDTTPARRSPPAPTSSWKRRRGAGATVTTPARPRPTTRRTGRGVVPARLGHVCVRVLGSTTVTCADAAGNRTPAASTYSPSSSARYTAA